jgi:predicted metal-dependent TIM-barrel fold hydrolase
MTGFIAQEVQEVIPDAVKQRADGYLELNVDPIHWATVNAVKELAAENLLLKERVDKAEAQIQEVRAEALRMKERATNAEVETAEIKRAICSKIPDLSFCIP